MSGPEPEARRPPFPPLPALGLAVLFASSSAVLIRLAAAPPLAVAFWRLALGGLAALLPAAVLHGPRAALPPRRELPAIFAAGAFLAAHFALWIASLSYTTVASSVLFLSLELPAAALVSHVLLRERLTRPLAFAVALSLSGAVLLGARDLRLSPRDLVGDLLSAASAVLYVGYLFIGRRVRPRVDLLPYLAALYLCAAAVVLPVALATGAVPAAHPPRTWALFVALALFPTFAGHGLVNYAVRYLRLVTVNVAVLVEPVIALALAAVFLGEAPRLAALAGGTLLLGGAALALAAERRRPPPAEVQS